MKDTAGFIKIDRSILRSPTYQSLTAVQRDIFHVLLLLANHKENDVVVSGNRIRLLPGQMLTSLPSIQGYCAKGTSIQQIRTCLLILEKADFLTGKSTNKFRIITICKWSQYQNKSTDSLTGNQQASNRQVTANKNVKNDKNVKNNTNTPLTPLGGDEQKILDFWYQTVGTQIRVKLPENIKAAKRLHNLLGKDDLRELLQTCRMIRANKYAGTHLFTATSNYINLEKNIEKIEAYKQGKVESNHINQPLVIN